MMLCFMCWGFFNSKRSVEAYYIGVFFTAQYIARGKLGHLRPKSFWNKQGNMGESSASAAVLKMLPVGDGPGPMPYPQIMPRLCLREN